MPTAPLCGHAVIHGYASPGGLCKKCNSKLSARISRGELTREEAEEQGLCLRKVAAKHPWIRDVNKRTG